MKTIEITVPTEVSQEIERCQYEINMRRGVVDRFLEAHINDPDGSCIESKPFEHFTKLLAECEAEYELAKDSITQNYIPEYLQGHDVEWSLDFTNNVITVTIKCDCDIPELEE